MPFSHIIYIFPFITLHHMPFKKKTRIGSDLLDVLYLYNSSYCLHVLSHYVFSHNNLKMPFNHIVWMCFSYSFLHFVTCFKYLFTSISSTLISSEFLYNFCLLPLCASSIYFPELPCMHLVVPETEYQSTPRPNKKDQTWEIPFFSNLGSFVNSSKDLLEPSSTSKISSVYHQHGLE